MRILFPEGRVSMSECSWFVTVTYNSKDVWNDFIVSVFSQHSDWQLIVVDNASTDGTVDILNDISDHRVHLLLNDHNAGVATANNQAIELALKHGANRILLLNNDVAFGPELSERLSLSLDHYGADAISPLITNYMQPETVWYAGGTFKKWRGIISSNDLEGSPVALVQKDVFVTDFAPTTCLMFRSDVFDRIGLLDERYFIYWEDSDLVWRMRRAGMRIIVDPTIGFRHKISVLTGGRLSKLVIRYANRNQIYFCRKFFGQGWAVYSAWGSILAGLWRLICRADNFSHFWCRIKAISEGFSMSISTNENERRSQYDTER